MPPPKPSAAGKAADVSQPMVAWEDSVPKRTGLEKLREGEGDDTLDIDETGIDEGKIASRKEKAHDDKVCCCCSLFRFIVVGTHSEARNRTPLPTLTFSKTTLMRPIPA